MFVGYTDASDAAGSSRGCSSTSAPDTGKEAIVAQKVSQQQEE